MRRTLRQRFSAAREARFVFTDHHESHAASAFFPSPFESAAILTLDGQKLSIFNLMGLLLTVAVGSNYCIFFERQNWRDANAERMVASLVLANICTTIGFGILSFARLPVLHGIGMTVAIGAILSLVFAAVVTRRGNAG